MKSVFQNLFAPGAEGIRVAVAGQKVVTIRATGIQVEPALLIDLVADKALADNPVTDKVRVADKAMANNPVDLARGRSGLFITKRTDIEPPFFITIKIRNLN